MRALYCVLLTALLTGTVHGQETYRTKAETTNYQETPDYAETMEYLRLLERNSRWLHIEQFGTTPLGRPLYVVVVSKEKTFNARAVRHAGKLVLLVQNGIHSGEIDGKDASLALIRDVAVTRERAELLDHVVLLVIPVFNLDGHEMMSPYNRINQNGPAEMGFRATAGNLNLNRDYLKVDAPEMRALVDLWNEWQPDFFIDNHVTDGADFQYALTYTVTRHDNTAPEVKNWVREAFIPVVTEKMSALGEPIFPYVITRGKPLDSGLIDWVESPRYSTGYAAIRNRPGLLVEMHMLKDYRRRVTANYKMMLAVLELLNEAPEPLRRAVTVADSLAAAGLTEPLPLRFRRTPQADTVDFRGYPWEIRKSEISGAEFIHYDTTRPQTFRLPYYGRMEATIEVDPPYAYLIPPPWTAVHERLAVHDVELKRLRKPLTLEVETHRLDSVSWAERSFEGRHLVSYTSTPFTTRVTYPAGTVVVKTAQSSVRLIVHALEPGGPDSFLRWGFFDPILEQKEYAEAYAVEWLARDMMAADPDLATAFKNRLESDSAFAANPRARRDFFYKKSPYAEPMLNVYPVGRLLQPADLPLSDY